ncbi:MAG: family 20 glycosylhydrolase [Chitinophagaceae bacterium]|nr:family 20 glycosylhydrolase [Chitinophagaceae bacterium]
MKTFYLIALFLLFIGPVFSQSGNEILLIPQPVSVEKKSGQFQLSASTGIVAENNAEVLKTVGFFSEAIRKATGYTVAVQTSKNDLSSVISFSLNKTPDAVLGKEGYSIDVSPSAVTVQANTAAGLFYGAQTLLQLLPKEIESKTVVQNINWSMPAARITDFPRFGWRGLMFDVSRHFFTKQDVKDFIDEMVKYKMNLLHLTLANDEGWRIQIKSLPKLTEVGAWNVRKVGTFGNFPAPAANEPRDYGGFYTHEDMKELIQYAKDRFVNILPEIDVPGHSLAAIASYPELSCTPGVEKYRVRSGEKIMDWHSKGFTALIDNTLCPANEKVYTFLDKVFTEVAELFPFEYIHMGGDECAKNFWEKNPQILALMKREKLKDMHEVQSYFVKRVEKIIQSKGKKMIGWDEILEGGLAPNAAVMSWRGMKGGIEAAKMGHEVVMSPTTFTYLDYMQSDPIIEPPVYASLRLKTAYSFEPVPDGVDPKFIKGGQGNLWTEQVYNTRHLQYMVWPRGLALAETFWSPKEKKNWIDFSKRVEANFERMDLRQIKYARAMFDPIITVKKDGRDGLRIDLSSEAEGLDIHYSFDNSHPDNFYPKYATPLLFPKEASTLKVVTYRDGKPIGRQIDLPVAELKKRAK